jgi:hypothetical protein
MVMLYLNLGLPSAETIAATDVSAQAVGGLADLGAIVAPIDGVTMPRGLTWWLGHAGRALRTGALVTANGLFLSLKLVDAPRTANALFARDAFGRISVGLALEWALLALAVLEAATYAVRIWRLVRSGQAHIRRPHTSLALLGFFIAVAVCRVTAWLVL